MAEAAQRFSVITDRSLTELRKLIDVSRGGFEAMMRKRARTAFTMPMPEKAADPD